jgi:cysteine desulfurase
MAANNEIGTIYPIDKIGQIAQKYQIPFLCDASQVVGKIEIDFSNWELPFSQFLVTNFTHPKASGR